MIGTQSQKRRHRRADTQCATHEGHKRLKMCASKSIYPTESDAIMGAIEASKNLGPVRYYKCPYCGCYHLTTCVETLVEGISHAQVA